MTEQRTLDDRIEELDLQLPCPFVLTIEPTLMGGYLAHISPVDVAPTHIIRTYEKPLVVPLGSHTIMKKFVNLFYSQPEVVVKKYYSRKGVMPGVDSSAGSESFPTR